MMSAASLTERQKLILALVIQEYVNTAQPVGSKSLIQNYHLDISSATVRNEMAALSEAGYLRQPYTSAGRVPTEEGYRLFVGQLMGHTDLPTTTKRTITHQFYQVRHDTEKWMRLAASVLASQSSAASLVTMPQLTTTRFKHLELISIQGRQILMVLVLMGGEVRQQMLTLTEPLPQSTLSATANQITNLCQGLVSQELTPIKSQLNEFGQDMLSIVQDSMMQTKPILSGEVYRDGITNVLGEPEFAEPDIARKALRVLEERTLLEDLLDQTVMHTDLGVVQVLIGGEGNWEELSDCSIILARYGAVHKATGTLGVLGPIRMRYGHTISTVRFVAGLLSDFVVEFHSG